MDIIQTSKKFLNTLYLKSKANFDVGCRTTIISKLCELDKTETHNVVKYLFDKKLITDSEIIGGNVKLTTDGIDNVLNLRENKIFKTIKYGGVRYMPSSRDAIEFLYFYDIIDENGKSEAKTIKVSISGSLSISWGFPIWSMQPEKDYPNLVKILLQFGKDKIIEKLKEGTLTDSEELILLTTTHPSKLPYNPDSLIEPENAEYEIEVGQKVLSEEIKENKLAASIIEIRDVVNNIFHENHKEKLLLLTEERNLLDFFKTAKTAEEFSHRLTSLGHIARHLNMNILRKLTNETSTDVGSVILLEKFLQTIGKPNKNITDILKHIGRIRQGYPVHTDLAGVINSYKYLGLHYPIENFEETWTILLNHYLTALKQLYEILVDRYLTKEN